MLCRNCMGYGYTAQYAFDRQGDCHMIDMPCLACNKTGMIQDGHPLDAPNDIEGVRPAPWYA